MTIFGWLGVAPAAVWLTWVAVASADPNVNISEITSCDICATLGLTTVGTNAWVSSVQSA